MQDNKASHTAYTVLQGVVHTGSQKHTNWLVSPEKMSACLDILDSSDEGRKRLHQLRNPVLSTGLKMMQRLLLPGIAIHYVTRKKAIEDIVRADIVRGARQVVNIGAGFDTLMYELSRDRTDLTCIELDHPATAAQKRQAFAAHAPANLHLHPVDLSKTELSDALAQIPAFDPTLRTCFICEGVLMYLDSSDVERVFSAVTQATSGGVQFIFTAIPSMDSPNTNATWLLKRYLHRLGEPLCWTIEKSDITDFLAAQGYELDQVVDGHDMRRKYLSRLSDTPFHLGEFVVSCTPTQKG
ncbi:SAM-dependent methyltransferase [Roseibium polysiphoniae]|uniref:S-adenosyl-L-methionine-dependent methyltransferase n=1 Tax=Roseibium polysiphoniae TaxID=2571221 RepID=A0A944CFS8_9HYPH|nr:SAM-dependent methyltransferase [Roseibium polysiphoniae]MBS8261837.1 SAM-dependent methyltransferase [Roseibium polysiphoniae]